MITDTSQPGHYWRMDGSHYDISWCCILSGDGTQVFDSCCILESVIEYIATGDIGAVLCVMYLVYCLDCHAFPNSLECSTKELNEIIR